jgi:hypothetical protein
MATREQLKSYFERGDVPTASQFAALIDSFRLISEAIAVGDVQGLANALSGKASTADVENRALQTDLQALASTVAGLVGLRETNLATTVDVNVVINWQNDIDPSGNGQQTYAQRHGNTKISVYAVQVTGEGFSNYTPNFIYQKNGSGQITTLSVYELFTGTLTII